MDKSISTIYRAPLVWILHFIKLSVNQCYRKSGLNRRPRKLSATPDLSGTVLPLCPIPNSASKSAPSFNSVKLKASA
ncbi:hypothetical protein, partial [Pseudomonas sp. WS 5407]|uniref:hypothetical protein n=1 Tax=Pseudomonas sp. WS 5407 TaxID=2717496 RepID=UPI001CA3CDEE